MDILARVTALVACYLIAAVSISVLYSNWRGQDIRQNDFAGASGMVRRFGWKVGLAIAFGDVFKGFVATLPIWQFAPDWIWLAPASVALGHCYPIWHGWVGGQGVAPATGAIYSADALLGAVTFFSGLGFMLLHRVLKLKPYVRLGSVPFAAIVTLLIVLGLAYSRHGIAGVSGIGLLILVMGVRGLQVLRSPPPGSA
ncbi:MAG: glycerol-3-phosphate acyltransferase [Deinococcales bacterium]